MKKVLVLVVLAVVVSVSVVKAQTTQELEVRWTENTIIAKNNMIDNFHVYKDGIFYDNIVVDHTQELTETEIVSIDSSWVSIEIVGMGANDQVVGKYYEDLEPPAVTNSDLEFIPSYPPECGKGELKFTFTIIEGEIPTSGIQFHLYEWDEDGEYTFSNNVTTHETFSMPWESRSGKVLFEVVTNPNNNKKMLYKKDLNILPDCSGTWRKIFLPIIVNNVTR